MFHFPPFFKAISHPVRQKIINLLKDKKELSVNALVKELGLSQSTVSHHLAILRKARAVSTREDGPQVFYSVCCQHLANCCLNLTKFFKA